jgi:hypothetical protein
VTAKRRADALVSLSSDPSSTVKPPRHAAYDATLVKRRAERWAGVYRSRWGGGIKKREKK